MSVFCQLVPQWIGCLSCLASAQRLPLYIAVPFLAGSPISVWAVEYGHVISATPITAVIKVPQRSCIQQQTIVKPESSGLGAVLGALAGGVVGNNIGKGSGNAVATGAGVIAGAIMGNKYEEATTPEHLQATQNCVTAYAQQTQITGYQVEYEYAGQRYLTQTKQFPGKLLPLNITVHPQTEAPIANVTVVQNDPIPVQIAPQAPPPVVYRESEVVYAAPPAVVYAAEPVYYPVYGRPYYYPRPSLNLNLGWVGGGWHHGGGHHYREWHGDYGHRR